MLDVYHVYAPSNVEHAKDVPFSVFAYVAAYDAAQAKKVFATVLSKQTGDDIESIIKTLKAEYQVNESPWTGEPEWYLTNTQYPHILSSSTPEKFWIEDHDINQNNE